MNTRSCGISLPSGTGASLRRKLQKRSGTSVPFTATTNSKPIAQQAYQHEFSSIMLDLENKRIQEVFDIKLDLYDDQLQINRDAAHSAYSAEQFKLNEQMQQASLNRNKMYKEVLKVQASQRARGETGNRSRARADLINSLGEFGRTKLSLTRPYSAGGSQHKDGWYCRSTC